MLTVGVGGGYQLSATPDQPYHFGFAGIDLSIKLVGPLRLVVFGRPAFSGPLRRDEAQQDIDLAPAQKGWFCLAD